MTVRLDPMPELYRSLGYGVVSTQLAKPLHP
jgi:hypothetical protein